MHDKESREQLAAALEIMTTQLNLAQSAAQTSAGSETAMHADLAATLEEKNAELTSLRDASAALEQEITLFSYLDQANT